MDRLVVIPVERYDKMVQSYDDAMSKLREVQKELDGLKDQKEATGEDTIEGFYRQGIIDLVGQVQQEKLLKSLYHFTKGIFLKDREARGD